MAFARFFPLKIWLMLLSSFFTNPTFGQEEPEVEIGGALRFNYNLSSWKTEQKNRGGDFGYDMFRINAVTSYKGIYLNAEYRLYSEAFGGGMLKQGWLGYKLNDTDEVQVGLTQVPFGIQQYNSHNWFFNLSYYMGLEDDHDMGVKYMHFGERLEYQVAFFKNAEELRFGDNSEISSARYSYDVAGRNKEINQVNGKFIYKMGEARLTRVGISAQYGGLYNLDTQETGDHYGIGAHFETTFDAWNIKAQAMNVGHNPANRAGASREIISMAAYGAPYEVAANFNLYSLAVAKGVPVELGPVSHLQFYNDFGFMDKKQDTFEDSFMNVTGVLVTAGNVFTYIDYAAGYNHSWLGGNYVDDFSRGDRDAKWEARFNINIGYYF